MEKKIKKLDDSLISKIAAGEVIERPASVVKELVENSIDADATQITVDVSKAGKKLVAVTDNGYGMTYDDAILSFERHATSKIEDVDDLFSIHT
ncbi:MAG: ATP-binding protein, partial [Candidatus Aenigmarchaeota archaeon]|nr:ATP-binding protein [Candidatus Aenigmarchaeota archaeon]